ncbi:MAG: hypothetical protein WA040_10285 [Anaerolineae bacterium]
MTTADLAVSQAVVGLGVSRKTLARLLNGHAGISPETLAPTCQGARSTGVAVRLSRSLWHCGSLAR